MHPVYCEMDLAALASLNVQNRRNLTCVTATTLSHSKLQDFRE